MYSLQNYYEDIKIKGLEETWNYILDNNIPMQSSDFVLSHLGELYEDGLARVNKISKKEMGKYYTPIDVANVMADWFINLPGENICDVCCGVGNLIIQVLSHYSYHEAQRLIETGKIYLYDIDPIAIHICEYTLNSIYQTKGVHIIIGDFLTSTIHLPENAKVISQFPPAGEMLSEKSITGRTNQEIAETL
jgi:type I restriction-modification system DNA methylase subunit